MTSPQATMPTAEPQVAIVLVNWNGWRDTVECLSSVLAGVPPGLADIYVVDNQSSDGSVQRIVAWCASPGPVAHYAAHPGVVHLSGAEPVACHVWRACGQPLPPVPGVRLHIVESGANLGFAGGNNVGIVAAGLARYSHFWLLNTDTVIRHDALGRLLDRSLRDSGLGMVGSTLVYYDTPAKVQALGGALLDAATTSVQHIGDGLPIGEVPADGSEVERRMAYVVGASMLVTREMVREVGLMQDDYFLYFEEIDWALRARPRFGLGYAPGSVVFHKAGGSSAKVASAFSLNLLYRNRLRFVGRFMPERLGAARRSLAADLLRRVAKGQWTAARLAARALWDSRKLADSATAAPQVPR